MALESFKSSFLDSPSLSQLHPDYRFAINWIADQSRGIVPHTNTHRQQQPLWLEMPSIGRLSWKLPERPYVGEDKARKGPRSMHSMLL